MHSVFGLFLLSAAFVSQEWGWGVGWGGDVGRRGSMVGGGGRGGGGVVVDHL